LLTHVQERNAPSSSAKLAPPILLQPIWLAEYSSVTGETFPVTVNGTYCAAMSPFSCCNMLTRHACTLKTAWPPNGEAMPKNKFVPIAKLCQNLAAIATPGYGFCATPAPYGQQVARKNEKPKPLKKTLRPRVYDNPVRTVRIQGGFNTYTYLIDLNRLNTRGVCQECMYLIRNPTELPINPKKSQCSAASGGFNRVQNPQNLAEVQKVSQPKSPLNHLHDGNTCSYATYPLKDCERCKTQPLAI
jgi:hypothetical protein